MGESLCIDSPSRGLAMPKAYSGDLRERVIEAVETGASRREAAERFEILALVSEQPDLTLVETVAVLRKRRIKTSRSSLWRFLDRHNITLKKKPASCRAAASRCRASAPTLDARARHA